MLERLNGLSNLPWIIGGDFNEIMYTSEKKGGAPKPLRSMSEFCVATNMCGLIDAGYIGDKFTWARNNSKQDSTRERLDRFLLNSAMKQLAYDFKVIHMGYFHSDHRDIVMKVIWKDHEK